MMHMKVHVKDFDIFEVSNTLWIFQFDTFRDDPFNFVDSYDFSTLYTIHFHTISSNRREISVLN